MSKHRGKREFLIFSGLGGFGLLVLPYLIYFVGIFVIGEYEGEDGAISLYASIYASLFRGEWWAILLVLSPWLVVQLVRFAGLLHRLRKPVTRVTE